MAGSFSATFTFSSDRADATFECSLDGAAFEAWLEAGSPAPGARPREGEVLARHALVVPVRLDAPALAEGRQ